MPSPPGIRRFLRTDDAPALCHDKRSMSAQTAFFATASSRTMPLQMRPSCFELRLTKHDELRRRRAQGKCGGQHELQRDKAHIDDNKFDPARE